MNTAQFQSALGRRMVQEYPQGTGGFAAKTVQKNANTINGVGTSTDNNPIVVHDDEGRMVPFPNSTGIYRPAHFEVVHSMRRDPDIFPRASSFRLKFSKPLRVVFAIEILQLNVPNVDSTPPENREFLVLNGLFNNQGKFVPQQNINKDRSFHTMITHNTNDPSVNRSAASNNAVDIFPYDDYALGRFFYDATEPFQKFNRSGWHRKTWFPTPLDKLDYLELTLADASGNEYDFPTGENWTATLQIFSKH